MSSSDQTPPVAREKTTGLHQGEIKPGVAKVDPVIVMDGIQRRFGGLTAVDVDHLEIPRNAITALIGPNGAGKTTLFNLVSGVYRASAGRVRIDPDNNSALPRGQAGRIEAKGSPAILVIPTDEERQIAEESLDLLDTQPRSQTA